MSKQLSPGASGTGSHSGVGKTLGLLCQLEGEPGVSDRGLYGDREKWKDSKGISEPGSRQASVMRFMCGMREGHVKVDIHISVLPMLRGQQTMHAQ